MFDSIFGTGLVDYGRHVRVLCYSKFVCKHVFCVCMGELQSKQSDSAAHAKCLLNSGDVATIKMNL